MSVKRMIQAPAQFIRFFSIIFYHHALPILAKNMKIMQICHTYKTFAFYQSCCMHEFQQLYPIKNILKQLLTVVKGLATHFLVTGFSATSDLGSLSNWSRGPTFSNWSRGPTSSSTISDSQRLDHLLFCKFANLPVNACCPCYDSTPVSFLILTSGSTCDYNSQAR